MSADDNLERLLEVVAAYPDLTDFGMGVSMIGIIALTPKERARRIVRERAWLFHPKSLADFARACDWWARWKPAKSFCYLGTSYGLKHRVAHDIGYCTNGIFIAAAISAGFKIKRCDPNAWFNLPRAAWGRRPKPAAMPGIELDLDIEPAMSTEPPMPVADPAMSTAPEPEPKTGLSLAWSRPAPSAPRNSGGDAA